MVAHTTALFSEYTQAVSFVHVNAGVVFLLQADNFGQIGQVTFHGKYSIHNNQLYSIRFAFLEFFFQSLHIVMLVLQLSGKCKTAENSSSASGCAASGSIGETPVVNETVAHLGMANSGPMVR